MHNMNVHCGMHSVCGSVCRGDACAFAWEISGGSRSFRGILILRETFSVYEKLIFLDPGGSRFNNGQHFTLDPTSALFACILGSKCYRNFIKSAQTPNCGTVFYFAFVQDRL